MKPILLLLPEEDGRPPRERRQVDLCRGAPAGVVADTDYSSVIVLNDGSADALRRLAFALAMRKRQPALDVGVLTHLVNRAPDQPLSALVKGAAPLRIDLRGHRLLLEYQVE